MNYITPINRFQATFTSLDKPYYDEMHRRLQTRRAKLYKKLRSATVEPVLGTMINFMGLRRIGSRGIKQANKYMLGAATAYNLKKWLRYIIRKSRTAAQQIPQVGTNEAKKASKDLLKIIYEYSTLYSTIIQQRTFTT